MSGFVKRQFPLHIAMAVLIMAGCFCMVGCQSNIGGQTLPSAYYLQDDVQYFAPGPEFKLAREAAAINAARADQELRSAP